jgi:hypothetical protein
MKASLAAVILFAVQVSPFAGDWRIDIPPDFKLSSIGAMEAGVGFAVTTKTVKITSRWVSPNGPTSSPSDEIVQTDGKPHPGRQDNPGWTVVAKWTSPSVLDVLHTQPGVNGVTVHITYSVSADRQTMTRHTEYSRNGARYWVEDKTFKR